MFCVFILLIFAQISPMKKLLQIAVLLTVFFGYSQQQYDVSAVMAFQNTMNKEYGDAVKSPLMKKDLQDFNGLDFYPANPKYFVVAKFRRTAEEKPFEMKTSTDRLPVYVKYGELTFTLDGKDFKLNIYQNIELVKKEGFHDYLFLPFSDLTSGKETYIGGRYIDMKLPKGDTLAIDFNQAYNPYCAYNYKYSCPIVPLENDLDIEIKAGVKKFHD